MDGCRLGRLPPALDPLQPMLGKAPKILKNCLNYPLTGTPAVCKTEYMGHCGAPPDL